MDEAKRLIEQAQKIIKESNSFVRENDKDEKAPKEPHKMEGSEPNKKGSGFNESMNTDKNLSFINSTYESLQNEIMKESNNRKTMVATPSLGFTQGSNNNIMDSVKEYLNKLNIK